jgi:fermentation-respiration switch protein FrsA (DUF1100 family)
MTKISKGNLQQLIFSMFPKIIILLLFSYMAHSQEITGDWHGMLQIQSIRLRLVFHISKSESGYSATMDSPDQGAKGIKVSSVTYAEASLNLTITALGVEYKGALKQDGIIDGTFTQNGMALPLKLSKENIDKEDVKRPQEPQKPYPYIEEEVVFENRKAGIKLAGTLTLPDSKSVFPAVVLISGSGAQNRDEELMGHKPFLVIADYLTRNGIAVLRYDDRGTAASEGDFNKSTSFDFSKDAEAAVNYLLTRKDINHRKIGLIGHSEGGMIASMIAADSKDVAFIVLLAGTGIPGDQLLLLQQELIARASGADENAIQKSKEINRNAFETVKKSSVNQITTPWMQYFLKYDPASALEKVKCPVLAINGDKDLQVPATINLEAISKALSKGGNKKVTIKELKGLNHLFQECQTGLPTEYATIEQTFSPLALEEMLKWLKERN